MHPRHPCGCCNGLGGIIFLEGRPRKFHLEEEIPALKDMILQVLKFQGCIPKNPCIFFLKDTFDHMQLYSFDDKDVEAYQKAITMFVASPQKC